MKLLVFSLLFLSAVYLSNSYNIAKRDTKDELNILSGSFYAEESKDLLVKQVDTLKKMTTDEIARLKSLNEGLKKNEKKLLEVETQLDTLKPTTDIGQALMATFKVFLNGLEAKIKDEIKKTTEILVVQSDFFKAVNETLTKAKTAVATLEKQGKPALVAGLKRSIAFLTETVKQLMNLKPTNELDKALLEGFQKLAQQSQTALEADLKKAGGFLSASFYAEESKDVLVKQVDTLKKMIADEIERLTSLTEGLEKDEKKLLEVETQLDTLKPTTDIGQALMATFKVFLNGLESKIKDEVKRSSEGSVVQSDIFKTVNETLTKVDNAEVTLEKQGKPALVAGLKKSIAFLIDAEKQLVNLKPANELDKVLLEGLQKIIKVGETSLDADLKKAGGF